MASNPEMNVWRPCLFFTTPLIVMKETFQYRQQMLHEPQQSADIIQAFPRFLDMKGLVGRQKVWIWTNICENMWFTWVM